MIEEVEQKLIYWGDQFRQSRSGARIRCALNTDGQPRAQGVNSAGLAVIYDVHLDRLAEEVDKAIASLILPVSKGGLGERAGEELKKIARIRYLVEPALPIEQQLKRMKYKTKNTYFSKVHQLHEFVKSKLLRLDN